MRIAFGGIFHESNTFSNVPMTLARFYESGVYADQEMLAVWSGTDTEFGGIITEAAAVAVKLVPTLGTWGMPAGRVTDEAFEELSRQLILRIERTEKLSGVILCQHGAMVSESLENADAELVRRLRERIGSQVPLVLTLDYHANISPELVQGCDALIVYNTYPHTDYAERGAEAVRVLHKMLTRGIRPVQVFSKIPIIPNILRQGTAVEPMRSLFKLAFEAEQRAGVINVSIAAGFPYADVPQAGMSVVVTTEGNRELARAIAEELIRHVRVSASQFDVKLPLPHEAVRQALQSDCHPVVLADVGDNVGGGTPGDGTVLLEHLLQQRASGALVVLADSEAVGKCIEAGVREKVEFLAGGKTDDCHGRPLQICGRVRMISDGIYTNRGPMRDGLMEDQGRTAVVEANGITLVLTERKMPMWNLQQLRSLGIEPSQMRVIVVKSAIAFRAPYEPIAARIIEVNTPGLTSADLSSFEFRRVPRPIFPLDPAPAVFG